MAYASQSGRARTSAKSPRAFAVCMRCGIWYNRDQLNFQYDWRGVAVMNTYLLVCKRCTDVPQEQRRAITLPADPSTVFYPSVEDFTQDEVDYRSTSQIIPPDRITGIPIPSTTLRVTEDCQNRTLLPFGRPVGLTPAAVMPYNSATNQHFGVLLPLLSVTADGSCTVTVTCSAVHGLHTDGQVAVAGLSAGPANGFYSVTVLTATAFTYETYTPIPLEALLTPTTRIITALIGLPRGYTRIPKIYSPVIPPLPSTEVGGWELEDGTGAFLLEDGITLWGLE